MRPCVLGPGSFNRAREAGTPWGRLPDSLIHMFEGGGVSIPPPVGCEDGAGSTGRCATPPAMLAPPGPMPHTAAGSRLGPLLRCASPALATPCRHPVSAPPESSTVAHLLTFTRLSSEDKELPPARAALCTGNCGPVDPSSLETGFLPSLELPGWEAVNTPECVCC